MPNTAIEIVTAKRLGLLAERAQILAATTARVADLDLDIHRCDQLLASMAANDILESGLKHLGLVELLPTVARDLALT
jgi:hypothetical protein